MIVHERTPLEGIDRLMSQGDLSEFAYMGDLGFSFRKTFNAIRAPFVKLIKMDPLMSKAYAEQAKIHKRIQKEIHRMLPKLIKAAPWLAIAAELLNFVVPGLGVAVALAITFAAAAYKLEEAKKAKEKVKKLEKGEQAKADAEIAQTNAKADKALMDSYDHGAAFFQKNYNTSRAEFQAKPMDERVRFLNIAIYDQHVATMVAMGVKREDFVKMSVGDQADALAKMTNNLPGAPGVYTSPPEEAGIPLPPGEPSAVLLTEDEDNETVAGLSPLGWALVGTGLIGGVALTAYLIIRKRRREGR